MTWWNRKSKPDDEDWICPNNGRNLFKERVEVLHEVRINVKGNEPFLSFTRPRMIVQLTSQSGQSHQFYEGNSDFLPILHKGDTVGFRLCRITQVPTKCG